VRVSDLILPIRIACTSAGARNRHESLARAEEQTLDEPADGEKSHRGQDPDSKGVWLRDQSFRRGFNEYLTRLANRNRSATDCRKLADSRQMDWIVEIGALYQEAKFLSRFNLGRAASTQTGLRHSFLAQCGPEGSAPGFLV
jgi:hypothetical protein